MRTRTIPFSLALLSASCLMAAGASAQDAGRGASIYRVLPGQPALGSCISCHGEPVNNRNSVLRGAAGADLISKTIAAVARMGYLRQYLTEADLADVSAYLGTIVPAGPLDTLPDPWPTADDFGAQLVGTQSAPREVILRNLQPRSEVAIGAVLSSDLAAFPLTHDCPVSLPPLGQCRIATAFRPQVEGAATARFTVLDSGGRVLREGVLSGTGVATSPPALTWSAGTPSLLDFGQVTVGEAGQRVLTLANPSAARVTLAQLRVTGANASRFTLEAPCLAAGRLDAGATCAVTLGFAPAGAGRAEGWIELASDASNAPMVRIAAAGVAAAQAPVTPEEADAGDSGGGALSLAWVAALLAAVLALGAMRRR